MHGAGAGAVVSKSLSRVPWEGYANLTVFEIGGGGWMNAVGISNPGAANFAEMIRPNRNVPIVVSLVGSIEEDFEFMMGKFADCKVAGYELNLSCLHVDKVGLDVDDDPDLVYRIVRTTKRDVREPVFAKVGLGSTNYLETVSAAIEAGADGITAINTIRAMAIDAALQRHILSNRFGGLSGTPIKPVALRCVYEISSRHDVPVMGCGGISSWEDAVEFMLAGASAVQLGSAVGDRWLEVFGEINAGIASYMQRKGIRSISEMVGSARNV